MSGLSQLKCTPCRVGELTVAEQEMERLLLEMPDWSVVEREGVKRLERVYKFKDFALALAFTNRVGELAEEEGHHPAILTEWGRVTVTWWTHAIKGLHQNDFILAAKTDLMYSSG